MSEVQLLSRKWEDSLKTGQFQGLAQEIKESDVKPSTKLDTSLIRLLVYICHHVTTQEKLSLSTASELKEIISAIQLKLSSIPDPVKYFSSLYHVVRIFLTSKYHQEALKVTDNFLPGTLWCSTVKDSSYVLKLTSLWAVNLISYLKSTKFDDFGFQNVIELIQYQLKLRLLCSSDDHRLFVNDLDSYYTIIKSYEDEKYEDEFQSFIIDILTNTKISMGTEDKYRTYESFLRLITDILSNKISIKGINKISRKIKQLFDPFREAVLAEKEIDRCFRIYELMCSLFTRPVSSFNKETVDAIDKYIEKLDFLAKNYGTQNAVRKNSIHGSVLLQFVLIYWENYAKTKGKFDIPLEFIPKLLSLIIHQADLLYGQAIPSCNNCSSDKCNVKKDIYNSTGIKIRILLILARIDATSDSLRRIVISMFEDCVNKVTELKDSNCESWLKSWSLCCSRIFNIICQYDKNYYQDYLVISELLCTKIKSFGVEKLLDEEENFLAVCLHRLGAAHYHSENYQAAMEVASLSAYVGLSTGECSSFRTWANCKYRYPSAKNISMVEFLESNKAAARFGITVSLDDSQKRQICLQEIKGLENCPMNMTSSILGVIDLLQTLNPNPMEYTQAIHLLAYHLLDVQNSEPIKKLLTKAQLDLKKYEKTSARQLLYGNLLFYLFVQKLLDIRNTTETEMQTSMIRLSVKVRSDPASNIVPAYSLINITTSTDLEASLKRVLQFWSKYCEEEGLIESFGKFLTPNMMIRLVIIAGEYAKFYHFRDIETEAWTLAMNLAKKFKDDRSVLYICSRSIMSRYLKTEWITFAEESVDKLKDSTGEETLESIAMFKLSLSSYYFYLRRIDDANKLFDEALEIPGMQFTKNYSTYLFAMDISISNRLIYKDGSNNLKYLQALVKGLYTVILIEESFLSHNVPREDLLYRLDMAMQFTNHITLRMNSLVSYREISAHLTRRLKVVQKLGSILHVADCLKNLCFLDLSRNQLEDCEVKLQGLEHILKLDTFDFGVKMTESKAKVNVFCDNSPLRPVESVRDIPQNHASPILMNKNFSSPEFMEHDSNCKCFKCTNVAYKYLVFSCTHIRAQLYAAQNNFNQAVEHFYGALQIIKKLIDTQVKSFTIDSHQYVEYVLFLLDFARFIKYSMPKKGEDALNIVIFALSICKKHKIENHPVYLSAKEMILESRFQKTFGADQYAKFVVPDAKKEIVDDQMTIGEDICTTPVRGEARTVKIKRRCTPPILTFNKANIDTVQEEKDPLTPIVACDNKVKIVQKPSRVMKIKPIRRKISDSEYLSPMPNKDNDLNTAIYEFLSDSEEKIKSESTKKPSKNRNPPKIKVRSVKNINIDVDHLLKTHAKSDMSGDGVKVEEDGENNLDPNDINCNVRKPRKKVDNSKERAKSSASKATKESRVKSEHEDVIDLTAVHTDSVNVRKTRSGLTARTKSTSSKAATESVKNELDDVVDGLESVYTSENTNVCYSRSKSSDSNAKGKIKTVRTRTKTRSSSASTSPNKVIENEDEVIENSLIEEPRRSRRVTKKSEPDKSKLKVLKPRN